MKSIYKIYVHPTCYVLALISIITGYFRPFLIILLLIIVHELGHIISSIILKWNIDKIVLLPLGGLTKFNDSLNRPIMEEFIIAITGPIFQLIFYSIFKNKIDMYYYHYLILILNLLPIYPLDGSKILNLLFNKLLPFKTSYLYTIYISYIFIILLIPLFIIYKNLLFVFILIVLLIQLYKEYTKTNYIFSKFCLERYLNKYKFKYVKIINGNNVTKMKRDCFHMFFINNKCYKETIILGKMFDNKEFL